MISVFKHYLLPGLIFQGLVIGGGYATGRELAEFFMPAGPVGGLWGMLSTAILWSVVMAISFEYCRITASYNYKDFFQSLIGPFWIVFEVLLGLLMIIVLAVVCAAAGEVIHNLTGLPIIVGILGLIAAIGVLAFYGNKIVEKFVSVISLFLILCYITLVAWCWTKFGNDIRDTFTLSENNASWLVNSLKYAGYNIACVPMVFFCLRTVTTRQQALGSGFLAGFIGIFPAVCLYIAMMAQYPDIGSAPVPSTVLLAALDSPWFSLTFQIILVLTLAQTGIGMVHAVNERLHAAVQRRNKIMPTYVRPAMAVMSLLLAFFAAHSFGIVTLIARGYGWITYGFIAVFVIPVLTIGLYRICRNRSITQTSDGVI